MSDKLESAFPVPSASAQGGLTKLEYAAIQLAAGMCQGVWEEGLGEGQAKMIADNSIYLAKLVLGLSSK